MDLSENLDNITHTDQNVITTLDSDANNNPGSERASPETDGSNDDITEAMAMLERENTPPTSHRFVRAYEDIEPLDIDSVMRMTPIFQGRDVVRIACRHLFLSKLKSQKSVSLFFPHHQADAYEHVVKNEWFDFDTYAVLYVCQAIASSNDPFKLHTILKKNKIDKHMIEICQCPEWKKIGFALYTTLFPDLVKDMETGLPFRAYLESDRKVWARKMYSRMCDRKWQYTMLHPVVRGEQSSEEYNKTMNILFIKLHQLDPTLVMPAFHSLQKALPELNLELATTNYLGGAPDVSLIKSDIETILYKPMYPQNVSKLYLGDVEVYYGVEILEFVMLEPRELDLLTEDIPDNRRTLTLRDRCLIM